jgi:predicted SprT family Zn-dependent metalloprotease
VTDEDFGRFVKKAALFPSLEKLFVCDNLICVIPHELEKFCMLKKIWFSYRLNNNGQTFLSTNPLNLKSKEYLANLKAKTSLQIVY